MNDDAMLSVRVPRPLKADLKIEAAQAGMTMQVYVNKILDRRELILGGHDGHAPGPDQRDEPS
jgi:predicted DNA binding CopG/RHH family protein